MDFWQVKIKGNLRKANTEPSVDFRRANTERSVEQKSQEGQGFPRAGRAALWDFPQASSSENPVLSSSST